MAVDVYSHNIVDMVSPRYSFSDDIEEENDAATIGKIPTKTIFPGRLDLTLVDSPTFDFAFNIDTSITCQSSTADELFSNGKILPTSIKAEEQSALRSPTFVKPCSDPELPTTASSRRSRQQQHSCTSPAKCSLRESHKKSLKEFLLEDNTDDEDEPKDTVKSFWKFTRSRSVNCDRREQKKGVIGTSWKIMLSRNGSMGKYLEKIVEDERESNPPRQSFWLFKRSNSLNNTTSCHVNVCDSHIRRSVNVGSTKVLRRTNSTSDHCIMGNSSSSKQMQLRRSSSLNCDYIGVKQAEIMSGDCLVRSNSTGSAPNQVKNKKQQQVLSYNNGKLAQKGQVKNGNRGHIGYGNYMRSNSVKVNPVLNIPSPYISRVSVDLFGIGSLFCSGNRDGKKRR